MSFNTLTPHYEEDVIFALAAADTARQLGLAGPDAHKASIWLGFRVLGITASDCRQKTRQFFSNAVRIIASKSMQSNFHEAESATRIFMTDPDAR